MEPERWQEIECLYHSTLQKDRGERGAFLARACNGDDGLRRAVELLLAQQEKEDDFLEAPAMEVAAKILARDRQVDSSGSAASGSAADSTADFPSEEKISFGPYRLIEKLGEGGMGRVWLAQQSAPVRRQVALKLIKVGMYDDSVLRRFESERQSLAIMDHPSIAKVFDAGTTPDGQPYFVMEYVQGIPITDYCDQKRLNIRARLELFIKVCEGVQHAHQKAVIHRDLKPANILVTEVDGKPLPRIIDFGLAKATAPSAPDEATVTRLGSFMGTPGYMSPEQADAGVKDVDTRTDIYSLGILLYVLLTGSLPFDTRKNVNEVLRQVREDEPPRPSTKIAMDKKSSSGSAENRGSEPKQLVKLLRGDLDWITMKALEKDRNRRYPTSSGFAADVTRYLNYEPVVARPASTAYRLRKYARRHRIALSTASALALVLIAATVVSVRQSIRARREAAVALAVNNFLQNDLLAQASAEDQSNTNAKPDPNITVRTLLDRAAQRIDGKFSNQPEVEVALRTTIGTAYVDLGLYPEARQQLDLALALGRRSLGADDPRTLAVMYSLGRVAYRQDRFAEAETLGRQTLEARRRVLGPENPDTLRSMTGLAVIYSYEGKYPQAESLFSQTLQINQRLLGTENPATLGSMMDLAAVYEDEGKYAQADLLGTKSLGLQLRILGPENPRTLYSMNNLADVYTDEGKYAQAEALYLQAIKLRSRVLGPENPATVGSMDDLANDYMEMGKYAQAESIFSQTLEIKQRTLGPENPDTAVTKYNMGCLEAKRGNNDRAIALISNAIDHGLRPNVDLGIASDADLTSLHHDPRFAALAAHAKQVAMSKEAPLHSSK